MELEDDMVTMVVTRDVVPGRERDYEEWARRAVAASARYGANGHTFLTPDAGVPTRRVLVARFPNEDAVRAWDDSEDRERVVREAEAFSSLHIQRATGLEAWFTVPGKRRSCHLHAGSNSWPRSWARTRSSSCFPPSSFRG